MGINALVEGRIELINLVGTVVDFNVGDNEGSFNEMIDGEVDGRKDGSTEDTTAALDGIAL